MFKAQRLVDQIRTDVTAAMVVLVYVSYANYGACFICSLASLPNVYVTYKHTMQKNMYN